MRKELQDFIKFLVGLLVLIGFYLASSFILKILQVKFPPAILGLILFSYSLIKGYIKENWINTACIILINNMGIFLVPIFCGLIVYKFLLIKNWVAIFFVIFFTTAMLIILTGLFVEWGIKLLRLHELHVLSREKQV